MSILYLTFLSYAIAVTFLLTLTGSLGLIAMLRRMRLKAQLAVVHTNYPVAFDARHTIIPEVFENIASRRDNHLFHSNPDKPITYTLRPSKTNFPERYQQTRLYKDTFFIQQPETDTQPSFPIS